MHPSATSTGQELVLSLPQGEVELWGQVSNSLDLELPLGMKAPLPQLTFSTGNQLLDWWAGGTHPTAEGRIFGEEKD